MKIPLQCIALLLFAGCSSSRMLTLSEMRQHLHVHGIDSFVYDCPTPHTAHLTVKGSTVGSLSFVHEIKLTSLDIATTSITDASPLAGHRLQSLSFDPNVVTNGIEAVRNMTSLAEINELSPGEFWTRYDAGAFDPPKDSPAPWPKHGYIERFPSISK